jgi:hypothetical protein
VVDLTPYSTAKPLMGPLDSWLTAADAERLAAYAIYDSIYRNVPEAFRLVQRGDESNPIYLPSAKTLIEAKHRFLAKRWTYAIQPKRGTDQEKQALDLVLEQLFRREEMWSKFNTQKRWGMVRGDQVWHITGDLEKLEGSRISIYEVDPGAYFPIEDPWNPDKIYGVHLVEPVVNAGGKTVIKRQTYRKTEQGTISYELSWWETGAWDDRDPDTKLKPVNGKEIPEGDDNAPITFELDPRITQIPVYHVKNARTPNSSFGTSELAGYETLISGINQSISDEDLALALEGLGLYWTNSGPPVDEEGNEQNWKLGPGWVVEVDEGTTFGRVSGVTNVTAIQDHVSAIERSMRQAAGVPDIAVGNVNVQEAESGIALAFQMGPLIAGNEEKEAEILSVMDHLLYDLTTMWLPVYEGFTSDARAVSVVDDPMPVNRKAILEEVTTMLSTNPPLISAEYARTILQEKLGYDFPDEMANTVVTEAQAIATARNADPWTLRAAQTLADAEAEATS